MYLHSEAVSQLLNGWHTVCYGIPEDIHCTIDHVSLWSLVTTADALHAGITDPYKLY
jgi:fatty acid synthase subunit alpha